jgi:hypothetical protein
MDFKDRKNQKKTGLKRDIIDKFYTKEDVVLNCYKNLSNILDINFEKDLIIEPSAGNGAFIDIIKILSKNFRLYDIQPENDAIIKQDYLELETNNIKTKGKIHIIGNPPFGRQSSLAIKFIKKSCTYADSISFILPKSFKKDSMKKHFSLDFHLLFENDLPAHSFLVDNQESNVPAIFQIWERKEFNREKVIPLIPLCYKFVKKTDVPHISFRRVGVNAGNIDIYSEDKSVQSHYFIRFTDESGLNIEDEQVEKNLKKIKKIKFECNNTVGPKSISKQELIKEFNRVLTVLT